MASDNFVAFVDFIEQHDACDGEIEETASLPSESGRQFVCNKCGDVFVMTLETSATLTLVRKLNEKGRRGMDRTGELKPGDTSPKPCPDCGGELNIESLDYKSDRGAEPDRRGYATKCRKCHRRFIWQDFSNAAPKRFE
jgi:hypothetical protein